MKKFGLLVLCIILSLTIFLVWYLPRRSYKLEYKINDIQVKESYNKSNNYYLFEFNYQKKTLAIISNHKYLRKKHLIKSIDITTDADEVCLHPESSFMPLYDICQKNNNLEINTEMENNPKIKNEYEAFKIYDLNNKTYLLWNYNNFVYLNNKNQKNIKIFNTDKYTLKQVLPYNNNLYIPDYDDKYTFEKIYQINSENGKVKTIDLRYKIYFDSIFLGGYKKYIYLYDKKEDQEYYLNIKKERIYKTSRKILVNNKWVNISKNKLSNKETKFSQDLYFNYLIKDKKLYSEIDGKYLTKISDLEIKEIVKIEDLDVYFLSDDTLYYYNPYEGIKPLISFSEWNFNYQNMIFVF